MRLSTLIVELQFLEARGFGDRRVIDDNGNDVMQVEEPIDDENSDERDGDDIRAVMLCCHIDRAAAGGSSGDTR